MKIHSPPHVFCSMSIIIVIMMITKTMIRIIVMRLMMVAITMTMMILIKITIIFLLKEKIKGLIGKTECMCLVMLTTVIKIFNLHVSRVYCNKVEDEIPLQNQILQ